MPTLLEMSKVLASGFGARENAIVDPVTQPSVAGVLTVTYPITVVSGALAITGIAVPYPAFAGTIILIPTGAFTTTAASNIAIASVGVVGKALALTYVPSTGKWYPSY